MPKSVEDIKVYTSEYDDVFLKITLHNSPLDFDYKEKDWEYDLENPVSYLYSPDRENYHLMKICAMSGVPNSTGILDELNLMFFSGIAGSEQHCHIILGEEHADVFRPTREGSLEDMEAGTVQPYRILRSYSRVNQRDAEKQLLEDFETRRAKITHFDQQKKLRYVLRHQNLGYIYVVYWRGRLHVWVINDRSEINQLPVMKGSGGAYLDELIRLNTLRDGYGYQAILIEDGKAMLIDHEGNYDDLEIIDENTVDSYVLNILGIRPEGENLRVTPLSTIPSSGYNFFSATQRHRPEQEQELVLPHTDKRTAP